MTLNPDSDPTFVPSTEKRLVSPAMRETFIKRRQLPYAHVLGEILKNLRPSERLALYALSALFGISALFLLAAINREATVVVPSRGGNITEGAVGTVRFINPILAVSQTDHDLTELVFSGLTKTLADGTIVPSIAASYDISEDGKTYTFILRDNVTFHDGEPITTSDVLFTIRMAQREEVKSPRRPDWEGVVATAPNNKTIQFTLPNAYAPFLENATLGILPEHLWKEVSPEEFSFSPQNTNPVGSGPFRFKSADTDRTGAITEIQLASFAEYALGEPHLRHFTYRLYPNEEVLLMAYSTGAIDSFTGTTPVKSDAERSDSLELRTTLPRVFGVFFNQNHLPIFADPAVRAALDASIDKNLLIAEILGGYGTALTGPIPPGMLGDEPPRNIDIDNAAEKEKNARIEDAHASLKKGGWTLNTKDGTWSKKKNVLAFTLATADAPELVRTAEYLRERWGKLGIRVEVRVYPLSELQNTVIRPRAYDALLFGEVVGRTLDLFAFWHSSQRNDPGLNLALYANTKADSLLAEARATVNREDREKRYRSFADIVRKDTPAVFLYAPQFTYTIPRSLQGVALGAVAAPEDRFAEVHKWYVDTERVWGMFSNNFAL